MSMLDLYGIKEVADVVFWEINPDGTKGAPVLYLDTLKVSTIEETAEQTEARGGKGNPPLIIWDYDKEITVTLEDALFSMKSMSVMHSQNVNVQTSTNVAIPKAGKFVAMASGSEGLPAAIASLSSLAIYEANPAHDDESGVAVPIASSSLAKGETYLYKYTETAASADTIEISSENFPGTYSITGDTYARSQRTGKDEFFQFEIPQAKVNPEQTITMQAEGDPSTFSMTVRVMRPDDHVMMKLTKYPKVD